MIKKNITIIFFIFIYLNVFSQQITFQQDYNQGKFSECIKKCDVILKTNSENPQANFFKGASLVGQKKYKMAVTYLNKAKSANYKPSFFIQTNLLRANAGLKQTEDVLQSLEKLAKNGFRFFALLNNEEFSYLKENEKFKELELKIKTNANPCIYKKQYKRLDFWLGEWDVFVRGKKVASSSITKSDGGCTLHEDYKNLSGFRGRSINYYDEIDSLHTQIWINNSNVKTEFKEITSKDGYLLLQAKVKNGLTRMSYTYNTIKDEVTQMMENSTDNGETWNQTFLGVYKRKNIESEIVDLMNLLDVALVDRDYNTLNKYYSDNLKLVAPNGFVLNKEMVLTPFKDSTKKNALVNIKNEDIQVTSNYNTATVIMKTTHSFNNNSEDRVYRNVHIYVKEDNIWKLEHITSVRYER